MHNGSDDRDGVDKSTRSGSTERYDRVSATLKDSSILMAGSSILFGFLLNIRLNSIHPPTFVDGVILLTSIYSVTIATVFFIMPVIFHQMNYKILDTEKFLSRSKKYLLGGTICLKFTMYLTLGMALHSTTSDYIGFVLAAFPFIVIAVAWQINRKY